MRKLFWDTRKEKKVFIAGKQQHYSLFENLVTELGNRNQEPNQAFSWSPRHEK